MNCALSSMFRSDRGATVLVGLRAAPQSSSSFARTIRSALRRAAVPTTGLRGHWLFLISEQEAIPICLGTSDILPDAPHAPRYAAAKADDNSDVRVVNLR